MTVPAEPGRAARGSGSSPRAGSRTRARILVGGPIPSVAEVEPNDRLRASRRRSSAPGRRSRGRSSTGDDVDVFAVEMKAGETLVAEAIAAGRGRRLDALVTILSPDGRELAADDDLFGRDAAAWATVPAPGPLLRGGPGRQRPAPRRRRSSRR